MHHGLSHFEETLAQQAEAKRQSQNQRADRGQIVFVFSVEGIVTLELAFSATLDVVPRPLFRARYHSLSRLKDAYYYYCGIMALWSQKLVVGSITDIFSIEEVLESHIENHFNTVYCMCYTVWTVINFTC